MKTLAITLKQHTPLIHFQHSQKGATLRATEVKPKLDRFVLTALGNGNYEAGIEEAKNKGWLIGKKCEHPALNYKIKIEAGDNHDIEIPYIGTRLKNNKTVHECENYPMLLSNMGGKEDKEGLVNFSFYETIEVTITIINKNKAVEEEIFDTIKSNIKLFFAHNNFGQRSSKGFGSFTVCKINEEDVSWKHAEVYDRVRFMRYKNVSTEIDYDTIKKIFDVIDFYWKWLKSGINYTKRRCNNGNITRSDADRYKKSYLYEYLKSKGKTWEKRKVKTGLNLECVRPAGETTVPNDNPAFFARAHLGCPINGFTYKIPQGILLPNGKEKNETVEVSIEHNNANIERIPSPITFKPVLHELSNGDKVVSIYILIDKEKINALYSANDTTFTFTNNATGSTTTLPLFINDDNNRYAIDLKELITDFHRTFTRSDNKQVMHPFDFNGNSILGNEIDVILQATPEKK